MKSKDPPRELSFIEGRSQQGGLQKEEKFFYFFLLEELCYH